MDNLTHALAGMLLAEATVQLRDATAASSRKDTEPSPREHATPGVSPLRAVSTCWRSVAYVVSVTANNLPDLDFLWSGVTARPFGYLLHHRGHSHTLPAVLVFALLLSGAVAAWVRFRRKVWSRADYRWITVLCVVGPLAHIAMDSSNNYGTHPFWPLYDGWIYGDAVFIVEPFFWAVRIPALIFAARSMITRIVLMAVLALGVALAFVVPFVPTPMAIAIALTSVASVAAAWRAGPRFRIGIGIAACWVVAALFFTASTTASAAVRDAVGCEAHLFDVVVTPMPANPFCFTALTAERNENDDYVARRATVATWPAIFAITKCPDPDDSPTARFLPINVSDTAHVHWRGAFVAPRGTLVALYRDNCQAAALLRFLRAPYWAEENDDTLVLGDLRYDRKPGLDFSDVRIELRPSICPAGVPPWTPPRSDLLGLE